MPLCSIHRDISICAFSVSSISVVGAVFGDGGAHCSFLHILIQEIRFVSGTSWQVGVGSRSSVWHSGVWGF